jgi:hypothetical protein
MNEYFARLNSTERRFVVVVMLIVFAGLNAWLVWPRFGDWKKNQTAIARARQTLKVFEGKIAAIPEVEGKIKQFESEGASVLPEDQSSDFVGTIQRQAAASGVNILTMIRQSDRTNQFFIEKAQALTLQSDEEKLVDFLYKLGEGNSLVRVRGLALGPDAPRHNLRVNVTLVGSYQRKAPVRRPPPSAATSAPAAAKKAQPIAPGNKAPAVPGVPKP